MTTRHDPGLRAVARVREVRERDAETELRDALATERAAQADRAEIEEIIAAPAPSEGAALVLVRSALVDLHEPWRERRAAHEQSVRDSQDARGRWTQAHARRRAVEQLLERRAAERAAERARREAAALDDIAGQRWARQRAAARADAVHPTTTSQTSQTSQTSTGATA
ncbi:hypothetical protein [Nocardioides sp.]|uniref:flagellar FliJ family protein n=1 Tax=Nocardioides sp. TaxID=35761 RepID=UPI003517488B